MFKKIALGAFALSLSAAAFAGPQCTVYPESERIPEDKFKQQLTEQGYQIRKFKVTDGNCYEIYGFNKEGKKVEIYFDMKTGEAVKTEIDD